MDGIPGAKNWRPPVWAVRLAYFFLSFLCMELVFSLATHTLGAGYWRTALMCLCGALILLLLTAAMPRRAANIAVVCVLAVVGLLYAAQLVYYRIFSTFFTLFSAGNGAQVLEFFEFIVSVVGRNIGFLLLFLLPLTGYCLLIRRVFPPPERPWRFAGKGVASAAVLYAALLLLYLPCARDPDSALGTAMGQGDARSSVSELGLLSTMQIDAYSHLFVPGESEALYVEPSQIPSPPSAPPSPSAVSPSAPPSPSAAPPPEWLGKHNALDIDFEKLGEESSGDKALSQLHAYFASQEPTGQNAYTGLFKGYNLIFMTCEGLSHLAIDKDRTPTLYKMQREGIYFPNAYNPAWGVSTTDGEYVACTGLLPKPKVWSFYKSAENAMPFVMGNQLRAQGYVTKAYHNHTYTYYHRDQSHPNMGYDYKGVGNGLDVKKTWPESDLEMMQKTVDEYIGSEPFHAYFMTVSGHLEYTFAGNYQASKHKDAVQDLPYSDNVRAYLACQLELEYALEYLMQRLEQAGIAERTLFVLTADHYPYGLTPAEISELEGHEVDQSFEMFKNAIILYAKGMEPVTVEDPVSTVDIIPTVSNLLGLPYDSRLLSGRDVFSDAMPLVMFTNRSFITDKGVYNGKTRTFTPRDGVTVDENYRADVSKVVEGKFAAAAKILETDYYRKIKAYLPQLKAD